MCWKEEWAGKIDENFKAADIILLLVSADFIASDYCYDIEMQAALERHAAGEARVIPVILRETDWQQAPFGKLQALPKDGRPITSWPNRDKSWKDVAAGIRRVIEDWRGTAPHQDSLGSKVSERVIRTFMFTDIVKSTDIRDGCIRQHGEEGNQLYDDEVLLPHDEILNRLVQQFGGEVVTTHGDSYFVNFRYARKAVECAIAVQREFISKQIPIPAPGENLPPYVQVRIGLHTGGATELLRATKPNYSDHTINIAARIEGLAGGEQVLASDDTIRDVGELAGVTTHETQGVELKGVTKRWTVHEVLWDRRTPRSLFPMPGWGIPVNPQ